MTKIRAFSVLSLGNSSRRPSRNAMLFHYRGTISQSWTTQQSFVTRKPKCVRFLGRRRILVVGTVTRQCICKVFRDTVLADGFALE
jgi:hypothetical protein